MKIMIDCDNSIEKKNLRKVVNKKKAVERGRKDRKERKTGM